MHILSVDHQIYLVKVAFLKGDCQFYLVKVEVLNGNLHSYEAKVVIFATLAQPLDPHPPP